MSAPAITTVPGVDRPQTVKETITEATVEKSWAADTDRPAADRARAKMKAEVSPPPDAPSKTFVKPLPSNPFSTTPSAIAAAVSASPITTATSATISTPTPASTARATPNPPSPSPVPTARATATAMSTPSVMASPSARPRRLPPPQRPSPALTVAPAESTQVVATPGGLTPAAPIISSTPAHAAQVTPRRLVPTQLRTPAARPSPTQPEAIAKPSPRYDLAPRPVAPPRVAQPTPVVTPPASSASIDTSSPPPGETKPVVRRTPAGVRTRPPADAAAIPSSSAASLPLPDDQKANSKRPQRPRPVEGEKPIATPAGSTAPQ
jgi:hypothetical protein